MSSNYKHRYDAVEDGDSVQLSNSDSQGSHKPFLSERSGRLRLSHVRSAPEAEDLTLTWDRLNVHVPPQTRRLTGRVVESGRHILNNVSGTAEPGSLLAIMGASGAGKSSLMNALTRRNCGLLRVSGEVRVNGEVIGDDISYLSAYVQQDDLFMPTLTVRETLIFQAMLRMGDKFTNDEKLERVDEVLIELGLHRCSEINVGVPGVKKSISGGERKRLSFASEILMNPGLLFCDEPTSGLDSHMAEQVVTVLRQMARRGRTVLCTIHQPPSTVFTKFDRLLLLAEGRTAFLGSIDETLTFFTKLGYQCPTHYNPADFYIHTLAVIPSYETQSRNTIKDICDTYRKSEYCEEVRRQIGEMSRRHSHSDSEPGGAYIEQLKRFAWKQTSRYKASDMSQVRWMCWRTLLDESRRRFELGVKIGRRVIVALIFATIYFKQEMSQVGVMNINGLLYNMLRELTFSVIAGVIRTFPIEQDLFLREHKAAMYRTSIYYFAKLLAQTPLVIFESVLFVTIMYWMTGLYEDAGSYFMAVLIVIMVSNVSVAFGFFLSALAPSISVALAIFSPLNIPIAMFAGFFVNLDTIPVYLSWMQWLSWLRYATEAIFINQWRNVETISCQLEDQSACINNGKEVLTEFYYDESNFAFDLYMIAILYVTFHVLGLIMLLRKAANAK